MNASWLLFGSFEGDSVEGLAPKILGGVAVEPKMLGFPELAVDLA